jgi:hypothetical protein
MFFFVKTKGQCVYTYFIWLFWVGWRGELRLPIPFSEKKKGSELHIVPLFHGDECIEMQE